MNCKELAKLSDKDRQAVTALCLFILEHTPVSDIGGTKADDVSVYTHYDEPDVQAGIRVDEISYTWNHDNGSVSGAAVMRCIPEAAGLILAAEDYILDYHTQPFRPEGWESDIDNKAEAEDRLLHHLRKG